MRLVEIVGAKAMSKRSSYPILGLAILAVAFSSLDSAAQTVEYHRPIYTAADRKLQKLVSQKVALEDEEWGILESYLLAKIRASREMPEVVLQLRVTLVRTHLQLGNQYEAAETSKTMLAEYREQRGDRRFQGWFGSTLIALRNMNRTLLAETYVAAAKSLRLTIPDVDKLQQGDGGDYDLDGSGFEYRKDENGGRLRINVDTCSSFDDRLDSDGDGVPDGCDVCWGFPDDLDNDKDGRPDGCDLCPGKPDLDRDLDGVPDGCDNCVGAYNPLEPRPDDDRKHDPDCVCDAFPADECCWQPDEDYDGTGDPCDNTKWESAVSISDASGRVLETMEYNERGDMIRSVKWGKDKAILERTFEYDRYHRMIAIVREPLDGSGPPNRTQLFYDDKGRHIGKITDGQTEQERFRYRDNDGHIIKVTTAADPPESAIVLESYLYDSKGRMTEQRKRVREEDPLEIIESHTFEDLDDGKYQETIRVRIDSKSERLAIETHEAAGRLTERIEYAEPVSPRGDQPREKAVITRYARGFHIGENQHVDHKWDITTRPDGTREVDEWKIQGTPFTLGSQKIFEKYETVHKNPSEAQKLHHYKEVQEYFEEGLGYFETMSSEPDGSTTTHARDPENPHNVLVETRRTKVGDKFVEYRTAYKYDASGRILEAQSGSPDERQTTAYQYDHQGRLVFESHDDGHYAHERFVKHDAFDNITAAYRVVHGPGFSMTYPDWHHDTVPSQEQALFRASGLGLGSEVLHEEGEILTGRLSIAEIESDTTEGNSIRDQAEKHLKDLLGPELRDKVEPKFAKIRITGAGESLLIEFDLTTPDNGHVEFCGLVARRRQTTWTVSMLVQPDQAESVNAERNASIMRECVKSFCLARRKCRTLNLFDLLD